MIAVRCRHGDNNAAQSVLVRRHRSRPGILGGAVGGPRGGGARLRGAAAAADPGRGGRRRRGRRRHRAFARGLRPGTRPLCRAAAGRRGAGSSACVSLLMERGARMEARDCCYGTPLHVACACQHYDCTKLLLNAGANVNAAKLHETALHHAAKTRRVDLIELLLEFGADPHARDLAGKKAVQYTAPGSPAHCCFRFYEDTPLSLQQATRVALRRILGVRALRVFSQLGLPNRMIAFLSYSPPPVFDV
ncbi:ankyrin repeat and SOCS box protein 13-like isoform X2 [Phyllopteryx taeniolatus]|uniref:ankyrin repeat and SOCS box protein 13-like isoform X2 n=1 Tax=Phyllopteryx taeniolatus TaxID=161469 RepID=UPI002AD56285|nr:ankyrin repeat and SOCS box protein 13-like isoform X2 [Phyllopteryx taeniolatus]XP_061630393.1 ankyrin repeat and SOCS box protein 13-like isoform X2 [Phyllopteryx taeniolatus]